MPDARRSRCLFSTHSSMKSFPLTPFSFLRARSLRSLLLFVAASGLAFTVSQSVNASGRSDVPESPDFHGPPAKMWVENLPAADAADLRLAPKARSVAAFGDITVGARKGFAPDAVGPLNRAWTAMGPFPIPNGQTSNRSDPVSGRVTSIAVHPTDANILYVGTAQGGLYRSLDGGGSWKPLMDNAPVGAVGTPLAIGSVTISPTDPNTVFVGTGEGNLSGDSFFGSGFYIITAAGTNSPVVNGPYNAASGLDPLGGVPVGTDVFSGRSIVAIAVDPTNANNVFVSTSSGIGGIVSSAYSVLPRRGLFRSTNALAGLTGGTPTWTRLQVANTSNNTISTSVVMDPSNPNNVVVAFLGQTAGADPQGIYRTTNALAATPTFTLSKSVTLGTTNGNCKLAINKVGGVVTVYATTAEGTTSSQGRLYKSTDGGATFGAALSGVNGFGGGQGFYDIALGLDPTNANNVSVGGNTSNNIHRYTRDGGATFSTSISGLHADVHAIAYAPSNPAVVYHGNDGGIWKSIDAGLTWTSLNNGSFSATQFSGIALHPTDRNFSLGGTQDNGTIQLRPDGSFFRVDFGDGGYTLIDQNATDTTNVVQYHTYFNQTNNLIGTGRILVNSCATEGQWSFHGIYGGAVDPTPYCDGTTDTFNGIVLADPVLFYAPMVLGPGNPNTWYFGTDKLYRSPNRADTAPAASQVLQSGIRVSAIGISPQDDNVRLVGLENGKVFATFNGLPTLVQIAGAGATNGSTTTPATAVGRVVVDPNNKTIAYVAFGGFGTPALPLSHVYKITGLDNLTANGNVTVTEISAGLPDIPANALAIDPQSASGGSSTDIYVGMDKGVYYSSNGGTSWTLYGTGLPPVSVFGMEIQNANRILRVATHGRGFYENYTALQPAVPLLSKAVSRKVHGTAGTFDIVMPLTGSFGVESRTGGSGNNFTAVLTFANTVVSGTASVPAGVGTAGTPTFNGNEMTIPLSGVNDSQVITVRVTNVTDINGGILPTADVSFGFLIGDTNVDRSVNASDIAQTKSNSGRVVDLTNFRTDVNADGFVNSGDAFITRSKSGNALVLQ